MTLTIVHTFDAHPVARLERAAEMIANECVDPSKPQWACAFHHAIDLLAYARGHRTTTRCLADYEPNELELRVEKILAARNIYRGMRARR